jgi:hypothetical protein
MHKNLGIFTCKYRVHSLLTNLNRADKNTINLPTYSMEEQIAMDLAQPELVIQDDIVHCKLMDL